MGKLNFANLKKTVYYLKRNGLKNTLSAVAERLGGAEKADYRWEPLTQKELQAQRNRAEALLAQQDGRAGAFAPGFSIVVPTYRTPEKYLREMIDSVLQQTYAGWELILADASGDDSVKKVVDTFADGRLRYFKLPDNAGIAENTNRGIALATGDYVGLLDHDDVLTPDALYEMAARIERERKAGIVPELLYSDEDKCNGEKTEYYEPNFKENFNLDLLLSNNYICHFLVMKRELIQRLKLRKEYDGAQDFDLVLRAAYELVGQEERIAHISKVLYHWRCHTSSTAENPQSKLYAYEAGRRAVQDFADKKGWNAVAENTRHLGFYRLVYRRDIFKVRQEVGAVGGAVVRRGRIIGGRMSGTGDIYYKNLPVSYSGYLHRAVLQQEAQALDIRNLRVREELQELLEKYRLPEGTAAEETEWIERSLRLSAEIRKKGYKLLYLPEER